MSRKTDAYLGYANELAPNELFALKRQYLPLGKVGGKPSWLNPTNIPDISQLACSTNDASNFVVFRNQLSRTNDYFNSESALDPWLVGDVPDPFYNPDKWSKLCVVCGCKAGKKCSRCEQRWYCSREHQMVDWNIHKLQCGKTPTNKNNKEDVLPQTENNLLFKEFAIEMDLEANVNNNLNEDALITTNSLENNEEISDDEEEDDDNEMAMRLQHLNSEKNDIDVKDLEHFKERAKDILFKQFHQLIERSPDQILRYERHADPFLATDHSPKPEKIPNCELCGAERHFEFQIMPHLLSLIEVDTVGQSIDWATLLIYTCSKSCRIDNDGYTKEFLFKQDFVDAADDEDSGVKIQ